MDVRDFDFDLSPELIAQEPPPDRGAARLLVLDRGRGSLTHTHIAKLPDLQLAQTQRSFARGDMMGLLAQNLYASMSNGF